MRRSNQNIELRQPRRVCMWMCVYVRVCKCVRVYVGNLIAIRVFRRLAAAIRENL